MTAIQSFRPIELHLPKWEEQRTVMLMELKEPIAEVAASQQEGNKKSSSKSDTGMWGLAEEMLRYTEVSCCCRSMLADSKHRSTRTLQARLGWPRFFMKAVQKRSGGNEADAEMAAFFSSRSRHGRFRDESRRVRETGTCGRRNGVCKER